MRSKPQKEGLANGIKPQSSSATIKSSPGRAKVPDEPPLACSLQPHSPTLVAGAGEVAAFPRRVKRAPGPLNSVALSSNFAQQARLKHARRLWRLTMSEALAVSEFLEWFPPALGFSEEGRRLPVT